MRKPKKVLPIEKPPAEIAPRTSDLHTALRDWRRELAKSTSVPTYVILHDTTIEGLCQRRPRTMAQRWKSPASAQRKPSASERRSSPC